MGGYDETPEMFAEDVGEYMRRGLVNIVGGCCGTTPAHIFELSKIACNYAPRPVPAPRRVTTLSGLEPLRIAPETNFVNVGERTNVAGSAKFARLIREGQLRRGSVGSPCAGRCGGADRRRLHGRRHDRRRRSHAHVPQPDGLGAGNRPRADDDRLLEMGGARGGSGGHAGQGRGQFDLAQGGRSRIPAPRTGDTPLRSRRGGDALRRAGTGRHLRAQDRGGLTRLPPADRRGIPRRRHHLRPQHTGRGDGNSRTRRLRQSLYRRDALDQGKPALRKGVGRRVEPLVRLPRQQRRARSDALGVPLPRHPRGHGHGHRQPANGEDIQRDRTRTAPTRRGRDPLPPGRRRRTAHRICAAGAHHGPNPAAGPRRMARGNARRTDRPRHAQGRSGLHRAGRAGGLRSPRNADGRDRHPADARHGAGRHALRRGQDVPAAGREDRPRDEARRSGPDPPSSKAAPRPLTTRARC